GRLAVPGRRERARGAGRVAGFNQGIDGGARVGVLHPKTYYGRLASTHNGVESCEPMPSTPHVEQHFTASETIRDVVIGMSDGLTVPFALAAGLSGAVSSTTIVVTAGLAEIAAGSIAMGLGGYLAARSDREHYMSERRREQLEVREKSKAEKEEIRDIFASYGLTAEQSTPIVEALSKHPDAWIDFMMRFELGLEEPNPK